MWHTELWNTTFLLKLMPKLNKNKIQGIDKILTL